MRSKLEKDIDKNDLANRIMPMAIIIFTASFIILCIFMIPISASIFTFVAILIGSTAITVLVVKPFLEYRKHLLNELKKTHDSELNSDARLFYINGAKKNRLDGVLQIKRLLEKRRKAYLFLTHQQKGLE
jgi:hypothetical protein